MKPRIVTATDAGLTPDERDRIEAVTWIDRAMFGVGFALLHADGTVERVPPERLRYVSGSGYELR